MQRSESFLRAVQNFKKALPSLRESLVSHFSAQVEEHLPFRIAFEVCFETLALHFRKEYERKDQFGMFERLSSLEPNFTRGLLLSFLVQHFLLEPLLSCMFPNALAANLIAQHIKSVMEAFDNRAWLRMNVDSYFSLIERERRVAPSGLERQHVFTIVCEAFINGFDPKQAEELSVIYTPPEVVGFMCASSEEQLQQIYGRSLSSANVPILDPCTGVGSFLVNVIGRIDQVALPYKYANELFGIEIMLLPYYLATLNIEQTFFDRCGYYLPFSGMRYADALLS